MTKDLIHPPTTVPKKHRRGDGETFFPGGNWETLDGTPRTKVAITDQELAEGEPDEAYTCPLALHLIGIVKPDVTVGVFPEEVHLTRPDPILPDCDELVFIPLPEPGKRFVRAFDKGRDTARFRRFTLRIPKDFLKGGKA